MEKKNLTPEESFSIINKAISNFKMNYKESAKIFLLWGWILMFASISSFIILSVLNNMDAQQLKAGNWELSGIISLGNWLVFCIIGFIFIFINIFL